MEHDYPVPRKVDRNHPRWIAVYGATIAAQYGDRLRLRGHGSLDEDALKASILEATSMADWSEEVRLEMEEAGDL